MVRNVKSFDARTAATRVLECINAEEAVSPRHNKEGWGRFEHSARYLHQVICVALADPDDSSLITALARSYQDKEAKLKILDGTRFSAYALLCALDSAIQGMRGKPSYPKSIRNEFADEIIVFGCEAIIRAFPAP